MNIINYVKDCIKNYQLRKQAKKEKLYFDLRNRKLTKVDLYSIELKLCQLNSINYSMNLQSDELYFIKSKLEELSSMSLTWKHLDLIRSELKESKSYLTLMEKEFAEIRIDRKYTINLLLGLKKDVEGLKAQVFKKNTTSMSQDPEKPLSQSKSKKSDKRKKTYLAA